MSEMVLEWLRDVQKMLKYRKYDVLGLCSTSSSAGNQVDGLPAVVVRELMQLVPLRAGSAIIDDKCTLDRRFVENSK